MVQPLQDFTRFIW